MNRLVTFLILILTVFNGFSQKKIKYKDLFPLLDAKNYAEAEPDLRIYLSNEKNQDEGNPNYQMGQILYLKFLDADALNDTSTVFAYADSTINYLNLAIQYIDDRELRKNDEYYQSFYRRDLRTGEFGIKLSDVHLEIEKQIESIELRVEKIKKLHMKFESMFKTEEAMVRAFNDLISKYESLNDFLLKADLAQISELGTLSDFQVSLDQATEEVSGMVSDLEIPGNYMEVGYVAIHEFAPIESIFQPLDGAMEAHDVDGWATKAKDIINGEITEMKRMVSSLDEDLADAKKMIDNHQQANFPITISSDLKELFSSFNAGDAPLKIIESRMKENIFLSLSDTLINPQMADTSLISYQLEMADSLLSLAGDISNLTASIGDDIMSSNKYFYNYYTDRYESVEGAVEYIAKLNSFSKEQLVKWDTIQSYWDFRNNWGVMENDTIPLVKVDSGRYLGPRDVISIQKLGEFEILAIGVDSAKNQGFIARFGANRKAKWEVNFDSELIEGPFSYSFKDTTLTSGDDDIAFYWYADNSTTSNNMTIVSVNLEGELNWATSIPAKKEPVYTSYSDAIKQHTIFFYPQEAYPLPGDELGYVVIDRNGQAK